MRSRRALLLGLAGRTPALRPPWTDPHFAERCSGCGDCIRACPEQVLAAGGGGIPKLLPGGDGCTRCGLCVDTCPEEVFDPSLPAFPWQAKIGERCLALSGVHCRACEDACPDGAIRFRPTLGQPSRPSLDPAACSGCTACLPVCPEQALSLVPRGAP